ncbi:nucleoid-associated protein [Erysipelotrichaceae bacterium]|nr:nucleoid-associated protein [Erysipelotrichaceae bacterium]
MMKQMGKIQRDIEKKQQEIDVKIFEKKTAGDAIVLKATGAKKLVGIEIDDTLILLEDKEILQDMLVLGLNELITEIEMYSETELQKMTGGMKMPGIF